MKRGRRKGPVRTLVCRSKALCAGAFPGCQECVVLCANQDFAILECWVKFFETGNSARGQTAVEVRGSELAGMMESCGSDQFGKCFDGPGVEVGHTLRFVRDDNGALARRVLCRNPNRALVCVATLRLDAAEREHEAAR